MPTVTDTDTMDATLMGRAFNLLARKNVPGLAGNDYFMVAHDRCYS